MAARHRFDWNTVTSPFCSERAIRTIRTGRAARTGQKPGCRPDCGTRSRAMTKTGKPQEQRGTGEAEGCSGTAQERSEGRYATCMAEMCRRGPPRANGIFDSSAQFCAHSQPFLEGGRRTERIMIESRPALPRGPHPSSARRWRYDGFPPMLKATIAWHALALAGVLSAPHAWPWWLAFVMINHVIVTVAGELYAIGDRRN